MSARPEDWEILGLEPDADLGQIRRAYRHRRSLYEPAALATYNLLDDEEREDMIDRLLRFLGRAHLAHDARALVAQDRRVDALGVEPVERVGVGVSDAGGHDLDQDFAFLRALEIELDNF